ERFDHVVLATHADQALNMLDESFPSERRLLANFKYQANVAHLHSDESLMPRLKRAWCSWNYLSYPMSEVVEASAGTGEDAQKSYGDHDVCVSYWMNHLQHIKSETNYFVTLNPHEMPRKEKLLKSFLYHHPVFDRDAMAAQQMLWNVQGKRKLWFCGSYFGYGFHEDALQSGLAVAEQLGSVRRPWDVKNESGRITILQNIDKKLREDAA
ncbi:MAG: NAD/FAD-binding protein, partial [Alphaproteobacteria bacterium]|nr:NAD/FAD-binding protein [Alphaproteobacteria bacterium]